MECFPWEAMVCGQCGLRHSQRGEPEVALGARLELELGLELGGWGLEEAVQGLWEEGSHELEQGS